MSDSSRESSPESVSTSRPGCWFEAETDSGLDSLEESDKNLSAEKREKLVGVDEMQVLRVCSQSLITILRVSELSANIDIQTILKNGPASAFG